MFNFVQVSIDCICKEPNEIEKYKRIGCKIYFVDNGDSDNEMRYVAIVLYPNGDLIFWDMDDVKIEDNHIDDFIDTLSEEAHKFIFKIISERTKSQARKQMKYFINQITFKV